MPADAAQALLPAPAGPGAPLDEAVRRGAVCLLQRRAPAARVHGLQQRLPTPTRGEGLLEHGFDHYRPVPRGIARRPRTEQDPLDRKEYPLHAVRRGPPGGRPVVPPARGRPRRASSGHVRARP
ncbi:hypothetical protein [Streptomyces sulfonofaciens]|uniref:hypothetical protein n=1 Tax=Streptomyces sulfonofaciens TaxID=68272 RepID=UPI001E4270F4|nr:hypothetical protein [Streptomyces sulfonofaciens]